MYHIVIYADPQLGAWQYSVLDGSETLIASGAEEGYDTYETVLSQVSRDYPGSLIAVPPTDTGIADALLAAANEIPVALAGVSD